MMQITVEVKLKRAAGVICKQGMVQFPLSDTAISIAASVDVTNKTFWDVQSL